MLHIPEIKIKVTKRMKLRYLEFNKYAYADH